MLDCLRFWHLPLISFIYSFFFPFLKIQKRKHCGIWFSHWGVHGTLENMYLSSRYHMPEELNLRLHISWFNMIFIYFFILSLFHFISIHFEPCSSILYSLDFAQPARTTWRTGRFEERVWWQQRQLMYIMRDNTALKNMCFQLTL